MTQEMQFSVKVLGSICSTKTDEQSNKKLYILAKDVSVIGTS